MYSLQKRLEQVLEGSQDRQRMQSHLDAQDVEIVITGAQNTTRIPQKQVKLLLFLLVIILCCKFRSYTNYYGESLT